MKKIISVILATLMFLSVFASTAFAAGTKTEKFIEDLKASKTISLSVSDEVLAEIPIPVSKAEIKVRLNENGEIYSMDAVAEAKIAMFDLKLYAVDGNLFVYVPLFRMKLDIEKLIGQEIELTDLFDLSEIKMALESDYDLGEFVGSSEENLPGYGKVTAETFKITPQELLDSYVANGQVVLPEGIETSDLSDEAAMAYLATVEGVGIDGVNNILKSNIKVCFDDDTIVNAFVTEYEADGSYYTASMSEGGLANIKTNIDEKEFEEPFLYFDYTPMFAWIGLVVLLAMSF